MTGGLHLPSLLADVAATPEPGNYLILSKAVCVQLSAKILCFNVIWRPDKALYLQQQIRSKHTRCAVPRLKSRSLAESQIRCSSLTGGSWACTSAFGPSAAEWTSVRPLSPPASLAQHLPGSPAWSRSRIHTYVWSVLSDHRPGDSKLIQQQEKLHVLCTSPVCRRFECPCYLKARLHSRDSKQQSMTGMHRSSSC